MENITDEIYDAGYSMGLKIGSKDNYFKTKILQTTVGKNVNFVKELAIELSLKTGEAVPRFFASENEIINGNWQFVQAFYAGVHTGMVKVTKK